MWTGCDAHYINVVRILSRLFGSVNIYFYWPIQIFGRNGPMGYCLFSPLTNGFNAWRLMINHYAAGGQFCQYKMY